MTSPEDIPEEPLTRAEKRWLVWFGFVSMAIHCAMAMMETIFGPTQPYIARNIGTDLASISFQWSLGGVAWLTSSIVSSAVFKRFIKSPRFKLLYFTTVISISGCLVIVIPFVHSLTSLCIVQFLSYFSRGCFAAVNIALFVYTMGPIRSRPFTMMVHCLVGAGFLIGSLIVRPFLPSDSSEVRDHQTVCHVDEAETLVLNTTEISKSSDRGLDDVVENMLGLPSIYWPYIIMGTVLSVSSWFFVPLAMCTSPRWFKMPVFNEATVMNEAHGEDYSRLIRWIPLLIIIFFFYCISCGIERIFQSTVFTFGLCGPLELKPQQAAISDNSYNGGFMAGRVIGTAIAAFFRPRNMLILSLSFNLVAAMVLVAFAPSSSLGLYIGSSLVGFSVSWQYGSAFSWTAQKLDVTGIVASLFAASCGVGGMSSVPVISFLSKTSPTSMIWAVLALAIAHIVIAVPMWFVARVIKRRDPDTQTADNKVELEDIRNGARRIEET